MCHLDLRISPILKDGELGRIWMWLFLLNSTTSYVQQSTNSFDRLVLYLPEICFGSLHMDGFLVVPISYMLQLDASIYTKGLFGSFSFVFSISVRSEPKNHRKCGISTQTILNQLTYDCDTFQLWWSALEPIRLITASCYFLFPLCWVQNTFVMSPCFSIL
jgi:hypothetical protein